MAILNCGAVDCSYNKDKCCCKGDIMVGGKHACECDGTCCESFHKKKWRQFYQRNIPPKFHNQY